VTEQAFANAIKVRLSSYIRLSIHSSTEATKLSISVIPQYDKCAMTPWHSSLVRALDGSVAMCHALKVPAKTHDLIMEGGCPWYFRERSELFNWSTDVQFKYLYPCGILIRPRDLHAKVSFHNIHMQKVRTLAEKCSPIVLRGFMDTTDRHTYIVKAYDAGKPRMSEIKAEKVEQKEERQCMVDEVNFGHPKEVVQSEHVKQHPRFRYITSLSEPQGNNPDAFFASSRLFWQNLPSKHSQEKLSKLEWSFESSSNSNVDATEVFPLAIPHPTDPERRCIRWPNNWHQLGKNSTQPRVKIQNGSQYYASVINSVLSDRRVCQFFAWEKGDVVLSDNIATLHGGRGFDEGSSEDFWQIDLD
jgi:alpha-ketoglutarate-dependent taurine dioxygenase